MSRRVWLPVGSGFSVRFTPQRNLSLEQIRAHTLGGTLNLFALGIKRPPGIEPGWTFYQQSLAHHLRHKVLNAVEETRSLGSDLNCLLDLPADFTFPVEYTDLPVRHVYSTPKPPAKARARWNRSYEKWSTQWTLAPITLPCRQNEYRIRDLPSEEPTFLTYQLPWEFTDGRRFFFGIPKEDRGSEKVFRPASRPGLLPIRATQGVLSPWYWDGRKANTISLSRYPIGKTLIFAMNHGLHGPSAYQHCIPPLVTVAPKVPSPKDPG